MFLMEPADYIDDRGALRSLVKRERENHTRVKINKYTLVEDYIPDIKYINNFIDSCNIVLESSPYGNTNDGVTNFIIEDNTYNSYSARTILLWNDDSVVCGYSQEQPLIVKNFESLSTNITFIIDESLFYLDSTCSALPIASANIDGLAHIDDPNIISDDKYAVYSKHQIDNIYDKVHIDTIINTNASGCFDGTTKRYKLFNGMIIDLFVSNEAEAPYSLCLTLNNGPITGDIPIFNLPEHVPAGSMLLLTYLEDVYINGQYIPQGWFAH